MQVHHERAVLEASASSCSGDDWAINFVLDDKTAKYLQEHHKRQIKKYKFDDHVRNLGVNVQAVMFEEFLQSVIANLHSHTSVLVQDCSSFKSFSEVLSTVPEDSRSEITSACQTFCGKYEAELGFWEEWSAVNGFRGITAHDSVAPAAAAIIEAARNRDEYPEAARKWAMLGALANYSLKNADALDAAGRAEREVLWKISEACLQSREFE